MNQDPQITQQGQLLAQRLAISFLLARVATTQGGLPMLKNIHAALVQEVSDHCQKINHTEGDISDHVEAVTSSELDKLFHLASCIYNASPDK